MIGEHVCRRLFDGSQERGVERGIGGADLVSGDEHRAMVEHTAVKPLAVDEEGAVAVFAHILQNGANALGDGRIVLFAALQDTSSRLRICI